MYAKIGNRLNDYNRFILIDLNKHSSCTLKVPEIKGTICVSLRIAVMKRKGETYIKF